MTWVYCYTPALHSGTKSIAPQKQKHWNKTICGLCELRKKIPEGRNLNHFRFFHCSRMMEGFYRWLDASSSITRTNNHKTPTAGRSQFLPTSDNFLVLKHRHVNSDRTQSLTSTFPQGHKKPLFSSMNWTVTRTEKWLTHFVFVLCIWNKETWTEPRGAS